MPKLLKNLKAFFSDLHQ